MKKVILFSISALMLLSALTGCSGKGNVSDDKDGKITEENNLIEDATDMISEIMTTEPTTQRKETTEHTTNDSVGADDEPTESTSEDEQGQARARRVMPRG